MRSGEVAALSEIPLSVSPLLPCKSPCIFSWLCALILREFWRSSRVGGLRLNVRMVAWAILPVKIPKFNCFRDHFWFLQSLATSSRLWAPHDSSYISFQVPNDLTTKNQLVTQNLQDDSFRPKNLMLQLQNDLAMQFESALVKAGLTDNGLTWGTWRCTKYETQNMTF